MVSRDDIKRAVEMLRIAARYIDQHAPSDTIRYDEAECDGTCVADDCRIAASAIEEDA
jgi:hypothetical protein